MVKINHTLYMFLSFYIDNFLTNYMSYLGGRFILAKKKSFQDLSKVDILSLRVFSIEQPTEIEIEAFPPLTSDLNIEILSAYIKRGILYLMVIPKKDAKRVKIYKQIKAARDRIKHIYPYYLFESDVVIESCESNGRG